ncbi:insulinase family protein [Geothermobacter hydrogeniphilus]|uniref:Insulinase family protein n=1 Tax=Geothermobacter hydrogeniphilus TaxID=1969733 RepID=A0A2K2H802_9BACT|nr:pitrilysin family protein [Geothermobacter hydrogeniphilus]PNU19442.1 insulinase family protein [Geothermobacter hydrogeniphilus]
MSRLRHLLPIACLLLVACQPPAPRNPRPEQLHYPPLTFRVPAVERLDLPNGIRLYLQEDHELPLVEVSAMLPAGSVADPEGKTGLADLYATVLRSGGAGDYPPDAFDELLAERAIDLSASSGSYTLNLGLSLQSKDLMIGLQAMSDMLRHPRFDPQRLELARRQALEAIRRRNDNPGSIAHRTLRQALYPGHPLGRVETRGSLSAISREDLLAFHRRFAHPQGLWLGITGDFDREQLLADLRQLFGGWNGDAARRPVPPVTEKPEAALWLADKPIPQTTILFGELGIDKDNPDLYAVRVMNYILGGGGFNSRLMREVRSNRGLAYSVYSYFQIGRLLPGRFVAGCETKSGTTMQVIRLMREQMRLMREQEVSAEELRLAKESLINSFVFAFEDIHDVVAQQMRLDFYGYPSDYLASYRDRIAAVTVKDVKRVARRYLHPDKQQLVLVGHVKDFDGKPENLGLPVRMIPED